MRARSHAERATTWTTAAHPAAIALTYLCSRHRIQLTAGASPPRRRRRGLIKKPAAACTRPRPTPKSQAAASASHVDGEGKLLRGEGRGELKVKPSSIGSRAVHPRRPVRGRGGKPKVAEPVRQQGDLPTSNTRSSAPANVRTARSSSRSSPPSPHHRCSTARRSRRCTTCSPNSEAVEPCASTSSTAALDEGGGLDHKGAPQEPNVELGGSTGKVAGSSARLDQAARCRVRRSSSSWPLLGHRHFPAPSLPCAARTPTATGCAGRRQKKRARAGPRWEAPLQADLTEAV